MNCMTKPVRYVQGMVSLLCPVFLKATTLEESAVAAFSLANLSLSESRNRDYRDDLKIFTAAARRSSDDDTDCLECLYKL